MGRVLLGAVAYATVAKLSQELLLVDGLAPVWAASGIAVLLAWRWGIAGLVAVLVGDLAASLTPPADLDPAIALGTAVANLVQAAGAAWLLRRVDVRPALDRMRDVWGLSGAAVGGSVVGALIGGTVLHLDGSGSGSLLLTWRSWAFGDVLGILVVGGLLLGWGARGSDDAAGPLPRLVEPVAAVVAVTAVAGVAVGLSSHVLPLMLPLLVLATIRGRARRTLACLAAAAAVLVLATAAGEGPFVARDQVNGLITMQALLASVAVTLLALGAALSERERVTAALRLAASARDRAHAELRRLALRDPLTGLANRELLLDRITQSLARATRTGRSCGVVFVDVDRFKIQNDTFGHARGDELLRLMAPRIAGAVRPSDTVARYGGDEFVIVCEDVVDVDTLRAVAERVLAAVARPLALDGGEVLLTATAGLALSGPGVRTPDELIGDADAAMYEGKRAGGGGIAVRDAGSRDEVQRSRALEQSLRGAAARGELSLEFQPVFGGITGPILAAEALLRWDHPELGRIPPDDFIGVAEGTGLIGELGAWVLHAACVEAATWGAGGPTVSVNVSARQLADPRFPALVREALSASGLAAARLQLELTESAVLDGVAASGGLDDLVEAGVALALDDFGTGWSSLARVRDLPLSTLKIDRSFVVGLETAHHAQAAVVRAIAGIGQAVGLLVVAEGVETRAQAELAFSAGASALQGFHLSRPLTAERFRALLSPTAGLTPPDGG